MPESPTKTKRKNNYPKNRHCSQYCKRGHVLSETRIFYGKATVKSKCGECSKQYNIKYQVEDKGKKHRKWRLKTIYKITEEDFQNLITLQNNLCAICGKPQNGRWKKNLHIDHDHTTGKIRGLLCNLCNLGVGKFKDDPHLLRKAANYLEKSNGKS